MKVLGSDGETQVGKITKEYSGFFKEAFTIADHFNVSFPIDLSVKAKASLLGTVFLIVNIFIRIKIIFIIHHYSIF